MEIANFAEPLLSGIIGQARGESSPKRTERLLYLTNKKVRVPWNSGAFRGIRSCEIRIIINKYALRPLLWRSTGPWALFNVNTRDALCCAAVECRSFLLLFILFHYCYNDRIEERLFCIVWWSIVTQGWIVTVQNWWKTKQRLNAVISCRFDSFFHLIIYAN